ADRPRADPAARPRRARTRRGARMSATAGERVVVALSGGVDSSVAAALLVAKGVEVIGVTLHLAGSSSRCCSLADADDARRVAERLGVPFYVAHQARGLPSRVHAALASPLSPA